MRYLILTTTAILVMLGCAESEFSTGTGSGSTRNNASGELGGSGEQDGSGKAGSEQDYDTDLNRREVPPGSGGLTETVTNVECDDEATIDRTVTFRTPLDRAYTTGDMGRRNLDNPTDKHRLQNMFNSTCVANHDPSTSSISWANPVISANKPTRDAVCRSFGYAEASDDNQYGYYGLASPRNDWAAHWNTDTNQLEVNLDAARAPTSNRILVWTNCVGQLPSSCDRKFKDELKCQSP